MRNTNPQTIILRRIIAGTPSPNGYRFNSQRAVARALKIASNTVTRALKRGSRIADSDGVLYTIERRHPRGFVPINSIEELNALHGELFGGTQ